MGEWHGSRLLSSIQKRLGAVGLVGAVVLLWGESARSLDASRLPVALVFDGGQALRGPVRCLNCDPWFGWLVAVLELLQPRSEALSSELAELVECVGEAV